MVVLNVPRHLTMIIGHAGVVRYMHNVHKLCKKKRAKSEVFGLFLDFDGSNRLGITYDGSPKCFSTYGSGLRSCTINQVCIMCINCAIVHGFGDVISHSA